MSSSKDLYQKETEYMVKRLKKKVTFWQEEGHPVSYKVEQYVPDLPSFNCIGCRKRFKGTFYWVAYTVGPRKDDTVKEDWTNKLGKVCSEACGQMIIMRMI